MTRFGWAALRGPGDVLSPQSCPSFFFFFFAMDTQLRSGGAEPKGGDQICKAPEGRGWKPQMYVVGGIRYKSTGSTFHPHTALGDVCAGLRAARRLSF